MCRVSRDSGASEPRNMAYMSRLGLWGPGTPFAAFQDFIDAIEKRFFCCDILMHFGIFSIVSGLYKSLF